MHVYVRRRKLHRPNFLQGESFGIGSCRTIFFPHEQKKKQGRVCVCMSVCESLSTCSSCYSTVVNTQMHQKFATFSGRVPRPAFWAFFSLQCLGFILIALCRCIRDPNACVCEWQTAALARTGIYACSATQTGFRSLWKSAPLQHRVGGFGWVFCSDTTEQQPFFTMIEKLISTLWWWWVWRAMIGVCFLPHAIITEFCLWKHKTKTYWDFGVVMKPGLCGALE